MSTGQLIRKYREALRLSQRELAEMSGVPLRTLEKIEQGVIADPKLVTVGMLAGPLGRTCADFLPAADLPPPPPVRPISKRK